MNVSNDTTLLELKKQFARQFPNLKLMFDSQGQGPEQRSVPARRLNDPVQPGSLQRLQKEGVFAFDEATTVADFEAGMQAAFGLPVQVLRKSGGLWTETAYTKDWSLGKQNLMGAPTHGTFRFNSNSLFL